MSSFIIIGFCLPTVLLKCMMLRYSAVSLWPCPDCSLGISWVPDEKDPEEKKRPLFPAYLILCCCHVNTPGCVQQPPTKTQQPQASSGWEIYWLADEDTIWGIDRPVSLSGHSVAAVSEGRPPKPLRDHKVHGQNFNGQPQYLPSSGSGVSKAPPAAARRILQRPFITFSSKQRFNSCYKRLA